MFEMCKLRRPLAKLDCLVLKMVLELKVKEIKNRVGYIEKACEELKKSEKFKLLIESVLMIGNLLNNQNEDAKRVVMVQAISFDSLSSLSNTKGYDKKTSLLSYLESVLNEELPVVFDVYSDLPDLEAATHESFDGIRQDEDDLGKQLKSVTDELKQTEALLKSGNVKEEERKDLEESKSNLEEFASKAQTTVAKLHDDVEAGKEAYKQTLVYFCQDLTLSSDDFFNYITDFFGTLLGMHRKMEEMRERMSNKKKKEEEMKSMKKAAEASKKSVVKEGETEKEGEKEKEEEEDKKDGEREKEGETARVENKEEMKVKEDGEKDKEASKDEEKAKEEKEKVNKDEEKEGMDEEPNGMKESVLSELWNRVKEKENENE